MTSAKEIKTYLREEMKEYIPTIGNLTDDERKNLREWVENGNSVYANPWYYSDDRGFPMDYINAIRTVAEMSAIETEALVEFN